MSAGRVVGGSSIAARALRLLRVRPGQLWQALRGYFLFEINSRFARWWWRRESSAIQIGRNVRIQNVGGIIAEAPMAAISIGDDTIIYENARIEAYGSGQIVIGAGSVIGDVRIYSRARVDIGARALFSWNVFIQDYTPHPVDPKLRAQQMRMIVRDFYPRYDGGVAPEKDTVLPWGWEFPVAAVTIGSDVWFGANSTVLPGARIGDGCVIASGSVVVRGDYPPRSVLAGNPARIVRTLE